MDWLKRFIVLLLALFIYTAETAGAVGNKRTVLKAYVVNKEQNELFSVPAYVVDKSGVILVDAIVVKTWLEDVGYNLLVKSASGEVFSIDRLIALSRREGKALISLEMGGRSFSEIEHSYTYTEFIKRALENYKNRIRRENSRPIAVLSPQASLEPSPPPVELPKEPKVRPMDVGYYKEVGMRMFQAKRFADAEGAYKRALELAPKDNDSLLALALIYTNTGRFEEAESNYKSAYAQTRSSPILKRLGALFILSGKYEAAIHNLLTFIKENPHDPEASYNLALAYLLSDKKDAAYEEYLRLKRFDPKKAGELFDLLYQ